MTIHRDTNFAEEKADPHKPSSENDIHGALDKKKNNNPGV